MNVVFLGNGLVLLLAPVVVFGILFGVLRIWLTTSKSIGVLLGFTGSVFLLFSGIYFLTPEIRAYATWPAVDGVVQAVAVAPAPGNGRAIVRFSYGEGANMRTVRAGPLFFATAARREQFARDYAMGTHHSIRPNPDRLAIPEVALGVTLEVLLVPAILLFLSLCLFLAARYYWRLA
jgi:hypothetical protein